MSEITLFERENGLLDFIGLIFIVYFLSGKISGEISARSFLIISLILMNGS